MKLPTLLSLCLLVATCASPAQRADAPGAWKPVEGKLATRWTKDVSPEHAWPEYPRPTMKRERWLNLNGPWSYRVQPLGEGEPRGYEGSILVPYPIESALSGVARRLEPSEVLWYRRTFRVPEEWKSQRVILHFGAVDWRARVIVNDRQVGVHAGGYDAFELDLTDVLVEGDNTLVVAVTDPTDMGGQPRGKQVLAPSGIWYTPTSGIWQTVWLEPVPRTRIRALHVTADSKGSVVVRADVDGPEGYCLHADVLVGGQRIGNATGTAESVRASVASPHLWTPSDPHLYGLRVQLLGDRQRVLDEVESYFGCRDIRVATDENGAQRLLLNGQALFQFGPLDQGFWPDGLYTAPTLEALRFDVEAVKAMGGNLLRKHVKVEPELFYAECDRLGVLVWQDMPSANNDTDEWKSNFESELAEMVRERANHPSIVMWVPFNEGWGQYDTERIAARVRELDPTRLVNNASGWTDMLVGDVLDVHAYPGPAIGRAAAPRASVLGEFGGLGLPLEGHTWLAKDNWGYRSYDNQADLTEAYVALLERLPLLIGQGLCAAVYTQTSDVEIEVNGWLSYDREVWKIDPERAARAAARLYLPPPEVRVVVPDASQGARARWRYTTAAPADGWPATGFDDAAWSEGIAGFGREGTPGAVLGTEWTSDDIWLRRTLELSSADLAATHLAIHHDEDAEVYLNGVLAAKLAGYTTGYVLEPLAPAARAALRPGSNVIAIHCRQTGGGQYVDAGLAEVR